MQKLAGFKIIFIVTFFLGYFLKSIVPLYASETDNNSSTSTFYCQNPVFSTGLPYSKVTAFSKSENNSYSFENILSEDKDTDEDEDNINKIAAYHQSIAGLHSRTFPTFAKIEKNRENFKFSSKIYLQFLSLRI